MAEGGATYIRKSYGHLVISKDGDGGLARLMARVCSCSTYPHILTGLDGSQLFLKEEDDYGSQNVAPAKSSDIE